MRKLSELLAIYTVFNPALIERIMKNHEAAIQAKRKADLERLST